jgi:hypothetical protein
MGQLAKNQTRSSKYELPKQAHRYLAENNIEDLHKDLLP